MQISGFTGKTNTPLLLVLSGLISFPITNHTAMIAASSVLDAAVMTLGLPI